MKRKISFSKNWNKKLNCDFFTTIRLYTGSKWEYYESNLSTSDGLVYWDVILMGKKQFEAILVDIQIIQLGDIPEWLTLIDAGIYKDEFKELMIRMYSKKPQWSSYKTQMMILCFKKMSLANISKPPKRIRK